MRALLRMTRSRALIEPRTVPARRALSAWTLPVISLVSPCTSEAQAMSPSTVPSMWRSAEAAMSPRMARSAPRTEKVEPLIGLLVAELLLDAAGALVGVLENILGSLQEGSGIDRLVVDADFEMQVRPGRAAGAADKADDVA